jgi:hypothetical protein
MRLEAFSADAMSCTKPETGRLELWWGTGCHISSTVRRKLAILGEWAYGAIRSFEAH